MVFSKRTQNTIRLTLISLSVLLAWIVTAVILFNVFRAPKVAFYNVSPQVVSAFSEVLHSDLKKVEIINLDANKKLPSNIEKYNLVFMKNGAAMELIQKKAVPLTEQLFSQMPTPIANSTRTSAGHFALPLLLDHFEIAYYGTYRKKAGLEIPEDYESLLEYLIQVKNYAEIPMAVTGADDDTLFGFVSLMAQSVYGESGYSEMIRELKNSISTNTLPVSTELLLNEIKTLQESGLLLPNWYTLEKKGLVLLMNEHKLGAFCCSLENHRKIDFNLIKYYESQFFPPYQVNTGHSLIAPEIVALKFKSDKKMDPVLIHLISSDCQTLLSTKTRLAPVNARAIPHDSQSDDVRFWAASCIGGPVPDLGTAAALTPDLKKQLAQKIRNYLSE